MKDGTTMQAQHVSIEEVDDLVTIGFADAGDTPTHYVILQRAKCPDEQDLRLGLSGVYLEADDQSQAGYDAVEQITLNHSKLHIVLSPAKSHRFGCDSLSIGLDLNEDAYAQLIDALRHLVQDEQKLVISD